MDLPNTPSCLLSADKLQSREPVLFDGLLDNLQRTLETNANFVLDILLSNFNFLTTIDLRWILGFQVNLNEIKNRKYLSSNLAMQLLYQHPSYIHKIHIPVLTITPDQFIEKLSQYIKTTHSASNILLGYSPNYNRNTSSQSLLIHPLRQLLLLYQLELAEYGEFGVISLLARARKIYIDKNRDFKPLDNRIKNDKLFSDYGRELLQRFYWPLA